MTEDERSYKCKAYHGRESPISVDKMRIYIRQHNKPNCPKFYSDIVFRDYYEAVGSKFYVAFDIRSDRIYFKFYHELDDDIHRYKAFPQSGKTQDFKVGDAICINVCNDPMITRYYSQLWYPVYYLATLDEYFIKLDDVKRKRLFENERIETMATRSVMINGEKLKKEFKKRNLSLREVADTLGVKSASLSRNLSENKISTIIRNSLENNYNIDMSDIVISGVEDEITVNQSAGAINFDEFYNKYCSQIKSQLYETIYSAVYEAVKKAWSE